MVEKLLILLILLLVKCHKLVFCVKDYSDIKRFLIIKNREFVISILHLTAKIQKDFSRKIFDLSIISIIHSDQCLSLKNMLLCATMFVTKQLFD